MSRSLLSAIGIRSRHDFRLAFRGLAIVIGGLAAFFAAIFIDKGEYWIATMPGLVVLVASLGEFVFGDVLADRSYPYATEEKIRMLEKGLGRDAVVELSEKIRRMILDFVACNNTRVSGTVHLLVSLSPTPEDPRRQGLLQLTDYVGPLGGKKGRITDLHKGLIGRCARTGMFEWVSFADIEEYRRRMISEFGYSRDEAERHTNVARSYLAAPLRSDARLVGVLYFFTTEPQVFPGAVDIARLTSSAQDIVSLLRIASFA